MSSMLTRWDPLRELTTLQDRMERLFRHQFGTLERAGEEILGTGSFMPAVDVYEDEQNVTLKMEVPGIKESELDVRVENNTLTVKGERKFEKEEKEENFQRIERRYGSFMRSFTLPNTVDTDHLQANCENGVLTIQMPKRAEAKPKQIKVSVGQHAPQQKTIESGKGKAA